MNAFIPFLKQRLQNPLPGRKAQLKMAPDPVDQGPPRKLEAPDDARRSGVLILLFPNEQNELELILTLRSREIDHGGQLSLPGGGLDGDESIIETALRETREEIGVDEQEIHVLGTLSTLYVSHSYNLVSPVVGCMDYKPRLRLNPSEVEEAFSVEVNSLAEKKNLQVQDWSLSQYTYKVPFWDVHRVPLWGATAMILSEFLELYREFKSQNTSSK